MQGYPMSPLGPVIEAPHSVHWIDDEAHTGLEVSDFSKPGRDNVIVYDAIKCMKIYALFK